MSKKLETLINEFHKETDTRLDNIEKVLILQEANLREHIRRTELLEEEQKAIRQKDLEPIKKHVAMMQGAGKFVGLVSIVAGIIAAIYSIFS
jgi:hypothetical protein